MFGSVALDVFIGLVLIYLLYSLLVSIIGEMIATWLGLRARILRKAMEKMLNDLTDVTDKGRHVITRVGQFFLYEFDDFRNSFAGRFYDHPSIKYLAQGQKSNLFSFRQGKPAYISQENFTDTLIQMFRNKGIGMDDMEKINYCLKYNTLQIQPQTLSHLKNLVADANNDLPAFKEKLKQWFNDTMDRTNGWYKRKLQLILFWLGFILAVTFNVDSIKIAQQLSHDKDARNQLVQIGISQAKEGSVAESNTKRISDSIKADTLLRKSFNEVYKATESANKILGLGWNFEVLRKNKTLTRTFYPCTFIYVNKEILDPLRKLYALREQFSISANASKNVARKKFYIEKTKGVNTFIDGYLGRLNFIVTANVTELDSVKSITDTANKTTSVRFYGKKKYGPLSKVGYVIRKSLPWRLSFWGFVITALMISLGAPFWFDLLKKLIALRGAGIKPEEKEENKTKSTIGNQQAQQAAANPPVPQPVSALASAVQSLKDRFSSMSGIISVKQGFTKDPDNIKKEAIEIHVQNQGMKNSLSTILGNTFRNFPVNYLINSVAVSHAVLPGQTILNLGNINGLGTLGCFVKKDGSDKNYLLSCWHVLKGDFTYNKTSGPGEIKNDENIQIAKIDAGALTNIFDVGFAVLISSEKVSNDSLNIKSNWRTVTSADAFDETQVVFKGATASNPKKASIYHNSTEATLKYPDGNYYPLQDLISLTAYDDNGEKSAPSEHGDSGAVVVDADGYPLGVVIGGDDLFTYAAKFSNILSEKAIYREYKILT